MSFLLSISYLPRRGVGAYPAGAIGKVIAGMVKMGKNNQTKAWKNGCSVEMTDGLEIRMWAEWMEGREVIFTLVASRYFFLFCFLFVCLFVCLFVYSPLFFLKALMGWSKPEVCGKWMDSSEMF